MKRSSTTEYLFRYRYLLLFLLTAGIAAGSYILAFLLRFDGKLEPQYWELILKTLPVVLIVRLALSYYFRLHRRLWRYASTHDLVNIIKAQSLGSLVFIAASLMLFTQMIPRSVLLVDWLLGIMILGGKRMMIRILLEWLEQRNHANSEVRTLIAGAGDAGAMALRILQRQPAMKNRVMGFVDDDPYKGGAFIHGCAVLGKLAETPELAKKLRVHDVIIAMPTASKETIRKLVDSCAHLSVEFRILPAITDVVTGKLQVQPLRKVQLQDLLGRDPISMDRSLVSNQIQSACVMITGAAGSIGAEIARQVAAHGPRHLVLVDFAESPLFELDNEIAALAPDVPRTPVVADIRNTAALEELFRKHNPQRVFHAAAYKHVPMMEAHPLEAVENNILGTYRLAKAAIAHKVEAFILISSDKAVCPANVMGATKRAAERIALHMAGNGTHFIAVRFGNVLGSNGSVIPIFERQIAAGGPVTVTHPDMERYFMTIPEAVELVLQAGAIGRNGDLFVLDMGEQVKIRELAENMIRLSGLRPGEDIQIIYTGLRRGEKLREELTHKEESLLPTDVPKLKVLKQPACTPEDARTIEQQLAKIEAACNTRDTRDALHLLELLSGSKESPPPPAHAS
jgi:FlaA1/EpsC-like NDP-sugar epimerase